ncbi:MAG: YfcZ/YiiS family protein [Yersiniaceae bacterium]|uniref:DUF406 domain-containing protein n=1 Tax=Chimaeribacter coloradensis TaxID=2060068 RepID=A0A2N5E1T0_9GAMM|nr:YfcZ/YiiS family protein [Chimaeribacter coloradensis]MDU6410597.1 YfcZ/YiiS family protein [Yersiniaceae bacterium]PLR34405.1 hypothetical protein CYR32_12105 [Chimaeribacter coloradensis]
MSDAIKACHAQETAACCCVDVGTIMDNSDCTAAYSQTFADRAAAEAMLATLTEKARQVESDPCEIESRITPEGEGVRLDAGFTFACQAETLIFQLGLR